jgi:hypothetical protein
MKMDIDRHGPRPMPNNCKNLNPPNFSLPSTFNIQKWELNRSENELSTNDLVIDISEIPDRDESSKKEFIKRGLNTLFLSVQQMLIVPSKF